MAKIFYVRHGQASLFAANYDNLSELGWEQSRLTGAYLSEEKITFDKVYMGPLQRHRQTYEGILERYKNGPSSLPKPIILDTLLEHEGPKVVKALLPDLIVENPHLNELASRPSETKKEQIKNYMRLYEEVTMMWAKKELDNRGVEHQSWSDFRVAAGKALSQIREETQPKENVLVVTSGGPVAMAVAETLDITNQKAMEISWAIRNASITTFLKTGRRFSLSTMNTTPAFKDKKFVTLV